MNSLAKQFIAKRCLHSSAARLVRQRPSRTTPGAPAKKADLFDLEDLPEFGDEDASSAGHFVIGQQRQILHYLRLIDGEAALLNAYREEYQPPSKDKPLVVRSISYGNEPHPATAKRTVVVPVAHLPLNTPIAVHKFILLAGVRWSPTPPPDSGIGADESGGEKGYVKISCEDFPEPGMNLKWASDVLDKMVASANNAAGDNFTDVPLDFRHLEAKVRKQKKGGHRSGMNGKRPSLRDFPQEWLPDKPVSIA
ncbi:hypothetical protein SISNIDRAFT_451876 [Sistotremastrum niveocremeum HHB9708]|uniref:Small ribosomal subunit protein mS35 mitochondrial conserved domain-containing protein n=1 Tax=Sistotremastrum niveocremeum HHB9708 TaxID=1314777 RepID=A0A164XPJ4_9AGAM|nr:hypothetical protein SISNIDRAFT_451876 [Sistotremastrum niveocremeum HHB9708]